MGKDIEIKIKQIAIDAVIDYDKLSSYEKDLPSFWKYGETIEQTAYMAYNAKFMYHSEYEHFAFMAENYFDAAYFLLETCLSDNSAHQADKWIFPILFDITQGIELYLKAIIVCLNVYQNNEVIDTERGNHRLGEYCNKVEEKIIALSTLKGIPQDFISAIHIIKNYIKNIYDRGDDPTFVRYPTNNQHSFHFFIEEKQNTVIDLDLLTEQTIIVYKMLDYIFGYTKEMIDNNSKK